MTAYLPPPYYAVEFLGLPELGWQPLMRLPPTDKGIAIARAGLAGLLRSKYTARLVLVQEDNSQTILP